MTIFVPQCIGPCTNFTGQDISEALHRQRHQFEQVRSEISHRRISGLTVTTMRAEVSAIGDRIQRLRARLQ